MAIHVIERAGLAEESRAACRQCMASADREQQPCWGKGVFCEQAARSIWFPPAATVRVYVREAS